MTTFLFAWLSGLQACVAVAHALRFTAFDDPPARRWVAGSAVGVYLLASLLCGLELWHGLVICIGGPVGVMSPKQARGEMGYLVYNRRGSLAAVRFEPRIRRYYQRKCARRNQIVAIKTVAHKLARACYYILRDAVRFDLERAFA